jgi:hypothetical protein
MYVATLFKGQPWATEERWADSGKRTVRYFSMFSRSWHHITKEQHEAEMPEFRRRFLNARLAMKSRERYKIVPDVSRMGMVAWMIAAKRLGIYRDVATMICEKAFPTYLEEWYYRLY